MLGLGRAIILWDLLMLMHVTTLVTASRPITRGASESEWNVEMITESYLPVSTWLTRYSVLPSWLPSLLRYIYSENSILLRDLRSVLPSGLGQLTGRRVGKTLWATSKKILNNRGKRLVKDIIEATLNEASEHLSWCSYPIISIRPSATIPLT